MAAIGLSWLHQDVCRTRTEGGSISIRLGHCGSDEQDIAAAATYVQDAGVEGCPAHLLLKLMRANGNKVPAATKAINNPSLPLLLRHLLLCYTTERADAETVYLWRCSHVA